jgi:1,4-dihydroxy-2-naphthoyl-CoA hydrolase
MAIWKQKLVPGAPGDPLRYERPDTLAHRIGIRIIEIGEDYIRGTMPVDARTRQPFGRLHGGASCVLAEELGSVGGMLCLAPDEGFVVGLEINANHVRGITGGQVTGTARPLHLGRTTQVWDIRIEDEQGRLVCISRLTTAVVRPGAAGSAGPAA